MATTKPIRDLGTPVIPVGTELILIDNGVSMKTATINDAVTPKASALITANNAVYDPQGIAGDAFARANHTGTQTLSTISDAGTAAAAATTDFATAAQGALADTATQPGDLGNSAALDVGTTAGTVAAGDDSRITGAIQSTANDASSFGFVLDEDDMASDSAQKVPTQQSVNQGKLQKAATRTAMKALDGSKHLAVYLMEAGREGTFKWDSSDLSAEVTADTDENTYVAPTSDTTGASGAWVRTTDAYLGVGSAAVLRSIESALRDRKPSVTDYGVGANGFEGALANAAAAISSEFPNGSGLYLPAGDWTVEDTVLIDVAGLTLEGADHGGSRILNGTTNKPALQMGNGNSTWRMGVKYITFGCASGVTAVSGNCGLKVKGVSDFRMEHVEAYNFPAALYDGIIWSDVYLGYVNRNLVSKCLNNGLSFTKVSSAAFIANQSLSNGSVGALFAGCAGIWGANLSCYGNGTNAFQLASGPGGETNHHFFLDRWIGDTSGGDNWLITDLNSSILSDCWGATQKSKTINTGAKGFLIGGNKVFNIQFNGGRASYNNGHGVNLFASGGAPRDIQFNGFDFGSNETELPPNGQGGVSGYGLAADASCTGIRVLGGQSKGNLTAPFSSSGIELIKDVAGYVNRKRGVVTATTSASGDITFNPGMDETPAYVMLWTDGTTPASAQATSKAANSVTFRVFGASGTPLASTAVSFFYEAVGTRA